MRGRAAAYSPGTEISATSGSPAARAAATSVRGGACPGAAPASAGAETRARSAAATASSPAPSAASHGDHDVGRARLGLGAEPGQRLDVGRRAHPDLAASARRRMPRTSRATLIRRTLSAYRLATTRTSQLTRPPARARRPTARPRRRPPACRRRPRRAPSRFAGSVIAARPRADDEAHRRLDLRAHAAGREVAVAQVADGVGDGQPRHVALPARAVVEGDARRRSWSAPAGRRRPAGPARSSSGPCR